MLGEDSRFGPGEVPAPTVADGNILDLVKRFLAAGVLENGIFKPTTIGTPQGGVISPLLANIVLNKLDWRLADAGYRFVRYADDFVVVCKDRQQAQAALTLVELVMAELGLSLSPEKTKIAGFGKGYDFLGFRLSRHEFLDMRQALSEAGQVDSHASPLHEVQTEAVDRQLPHETEDVRQETRAVTNAGFYCHYHEKVVDMIPHSIPLRGRDGIAAEGAMIRGAPGARKTHAGKYEE